jgi:hypothetical protein
MPDHPWKAEERHVARLLGGHRYPANSGGRVDVEGPGVVAQVKHVKTCSLARLEALAVEMAKVGHQRGKVGLVVLKRRAGRGQATPRLVVMTEAVWRGLRETNGTPVYSQKRLKGGGTVQDESATYSQGSRPDAFVQ